MESSSMLIGCCSTRHPPLAPLSVRTKIAEFVALAFAVSTVIL
jgi:hypothetical protein